MEREAKGLCTGLRATQLVLVRAGGRDPAPSSTSREAKKKKPDPSQWNHATRNFELSPRKASTSLRKLFFQLPA